MTGCSAWPPGPPPRSRRRRRRGSGWVRCQASASRRSTSPRSSLRAEGFTDIRYPPVSGGVPGAKEMGAGDADIAMNFAAPLVVALDGGAPIVVLAGVHVGCFELFATDRVRTIKDLKGKTVAVFGLESPSTSSSPAWQPSGSRSAQGHHLGDPSVDRGQATPRRGQDRRVPRVSPDPQELRAKKVGHVIVNSATDRPWSQYFCCMVMANRDSSPGIRSPPSARCARS